MKTEQRIRIMRAYGIVYPELVVEACAATKLPESAACAMLENESYGGKNIFGADPGGNALPRRWFNTKVTWMKYKIYKRRRKHGMTANGVGPCQLTSASLQDAADIRGGCHKPKFNMIVGFSFLRSLMRQHGEAGGFAAYNGSGSAAQAYGRRAVQRAQIWHHRLT